MLGVSPESRSVLGKSLLFPGACSIFVLCQGCHHGTGHSPPALQDALGSHQLLLMQVAFGDSF